MAFNESETLAELRVGLAQRLLGIHFQESRQIHQDEQHIAELAFQFRGRAVFTRLGQFAQLFIQFVEYLLGIFPIEANRRGLGADLLRFHQRR